MTVLFVDQNHQAASDTNSGAEDNPFLTIQAAVNAAGPGDTVYIKEGIYSQFDVRSSGEPGNRIVIESWRGNATRPIIDGQDQSGRGIIEINGQSHIEVRGLDIQNAHTDGIYIQGSVEGERDIIIDDNIVYHTGNSGIYAAGLIMGQTIPADEYRLFDIVISNNNVSRTNEPDGGNEAITVGGGVNGFEIFGNHVHNTEQFGIDIKLGVINGSIHNNLIHDIEHFGIYVDAASRAIKNVDIYDNVIYNARYGLVLARESDRDPTNPVIDGIRIYDNEIHSNQTFGILIYRHKWDSELGTFNDVTIQGNTVYNNGQYGIRLVDLDWATQISLIDNIVYDNPTNVSNLIGADERGTIETKPVEEQPTNTPDTAEDIGTDEPTVEPEIPEPTENPEVREPTDEPDVPAPTENSDVNEPTEDADGSPEDGSTGDSDEIPSDNYEDPSNENPDLPAESEIDETETSQAATGPDGDLEIDQSNDDAEPDPVVQPDQETPTDEEVVPVDDREEDPIGVSPPEEGEESQNRDADSDSSAPAPTVEVRFEGVQINGIPFVGRTLNAEIMASDANSYPDPGAVSFQWMRDGNPIEGATTDTYIVTSQDLNAELSVRLTVTDGSQTTETFVSANSGPVIGPLMLGSNTSDQFIAVEGMQLIDGGAGVDSVLMPGSQSDYTISLSMQGIEIVDRTSNGATPIALRDIELVNFDNERLAREDSLDLREFTGHTQLDADTLESFIGIYIAYFNRAPDALGLSFWATAYADGMSLEDIVDEFASQPETQQIYSGLSHDLQFIAEVYHNVLGRAPDYDGLMFWAEALESGEVLRSDFILEILHGVDAETSPELAPGIQIQKEIDKDFLSTKIDLGAYFAVTLGMSNLQNASVVMDLYDGSSASTNAAINEIDSMFENASSNLDGEFLMPLVGVIDSPFVE